MDLKPGKLILYFGLFALLVSVILIYVLLFVLNYEKGGQISVALLFLGFFSIGVYLTLHYYNYKIIITDKSMIIKNEIKSKKEIFWNKIDKVSFNKYFKMYVVFCDEKKTWISPIYGHFIENVPLDKYSENLKEMIRNNERG